MTNSFAVVVVIQRAIEHIHPHGMKFAEKRRKPRGALARGFRRHAVHFAAIASREYQRFRENPFRTQLVGGAPSLIGGEGHPLAHLNGRSAVIQSDENDLHSEALSPLKVPVTVRKIEIHNGKTQKDDNKIEDTQL